ncbi:hypothetical protein ANCDUO_13071 [Ancylostoma duodenale]|uniref:RING-type domain-containing protein n=1 Tax=Ancylostoma duodenale TaxID=51022 RepID=A0A0C2G6Z9_9BILA|nr:hypothetical protein ANCDUO_13071 [Ancylostoma duodenale]
MAGLKEPSVISLRISSGLGADNKKNVGKHVYHKSCIDPWLLEHRTCPMCKADILKYFGYQVSTSGGGDPSRMEADREREESPEPPSSSESNGAYNFPPTHDLQDAFHFTPNTSPQLFLKLAVAQTRENLVESEDSAKKIHAESAFSVLPSGCGEVSSTIDHIVALYKKDNVGKE